MCGINDCNTEWPFEEVGKMALLTPEEMEDFEIDVAYNAARFSETKSVSVSTKILNICTMKITFGLSGYI